MNKDDSDIAVGSFIAFCILIVAIALLGFFVSK
jgi:hypothetical protein